MIFSKFFGPVIQSRSSAEKVPPSRSVRRPESQSDASIRSRKAFQASGVLPNSRHTRRSAATRCAVILLSLDPDGTRWW